MNPSTITLLFLVLAIVMFVDVYKRQAKNVEKLKNLEAQQEGRNSFLAKIR